jgi:hypothetical protein
VSVIPIAGDYTTQTGRTVDAKWELLRDSKSNSDADLEGLRGEFHGGVYPFNKKGGTDQQAVVEFICDKKRTGLESDEKDDSDKEEGDDDKVKRDEVEGPSLRFVKYGLEELEKGKKIGVLRLEWRTKEACEDALDQNPGSGSWGFFTWFIIM